MGDCLNLRDGKTTLELDPGLAGMSMAREGIMLPSDCHRFVDFWDKPFGSEDLDKELVDLIVNVMGGSLE